VSLVPDPHEIERTLASLRPAGRRLLSLKDVIESGRPAVYRRFGDELLFMGGTLYDVVQESRPTELELQTPLHDPSFENETVGIEYGWRHALGCSCPLCALPEPAVLLPALRVPVYPAARARHVSGEPVSR
jgi:hypothetical protein